MLQKCFPGVLAVLFLLSSCSLSKKIGKQAEKQVLSDSSLTSAHVGISIYEPGTGKYWYNHNADKYFIPASNTKIFTCYAAMKYLGDSLPAMRISETPSEIILEGTGDPTLLWPEFSYQPVYDFLKTKSKPISLYTGNWKATRYGRGWAWDDYGEDYCVERSALPVYGNLEHFYIEGKMLKYVPYYVQDFSKEYPSSKYPYNNALPYLHTGNLPPKFSVKRWSPNNNVFSIYESATPFKTKALPRQVDEFEHLAFLKDTVYHTRYGNDSVVQNSFYSRPQFTQLIRSQPLDSFLKPMMHRSDNFFAEQALLMAANEFLGYMNDAAIIDTLLKTEFKNIPQKPRWMDGSGLSRYNLFTPQSIIWVLNKIYSEFGLPRIKEIFATGGEGTLSNYYLNIKGRIFAKTGTLSNHCALSGFLITKKGKLLIFSVLSGSYPGGATAVRRAVEKFITGIYNQY